MGCGSSQPMALRAFEGAKEDAGSALGSKSHLPTSEEGKAVFRRLNSLWSQCSAYTTNTAAPLTPDALRHLRSYSSALGEGIAPLRTYDGKWVRFEYPDVGAWVVGQDGSSGSVRIQNTHIPTMFVGMSTAPMSTPYNSEEYCKVFIERVQPLARAQPNTSSVDVSATTPLTVSGISLQEFMITITRSSRRQVGQWEVHGMHPCGKFGYNITCNVPDSEIFMPSLLPLFRSIVQSILFASLAVTFDTYGDFWMKNGCKFTKSDIEQVKSGDLDCAA